MNDQKDTVQENTQPARDDDACPPPSARAPATDEFELTIRKLELPVRPRGVLAE